MYLKRKIFNIERKIDNINKILTKSNLEDMAQILGNTKRMLWKNFLAGISRGIGIAIGVTILSAILLYILQKIVILNIPIIGDYISDIAEIVKTKM